MVFWLQNSLIDKQVKRNILTAKKSVHGQRDFKQAIYQYGPITRSVCIPNWILVACLRDTFYQASPNQATFLNFSFVEFSARGSKLVQVASCFLGNLQGASKKKDPLREF